MDTSNRRPQLPALTYLDVDKVKREEEAAYQSRNTGGAGTPQSLSTSAAASPTYHYPPGPPPPYNSHAHGAPPPQAHHANTWSGAQQAAHTPPESRRTSEHEKEEAKQPPRQSLPSISEALGVDSQTSFAPSSAVPPALHPAQLPPPQAVPPTSPSPTPRRSYPMDPPQGPPTSFSSSNGYLPLSQHRSDSAQQPSYPAPSEVTRPPVAYPPVQEAKPHASLQPSQHPRPPHSSTFSRPSEHAPIQSQSNGSAGASSTFPYGYAAYPPRYANPTPPSSVSSGPIYQPSVYAQAQTGPSGWKSEPPSRHEDRQATYGENVKRHLDFYDLEQALNDIASASGILTDFSRRYGDRMHQTQRSGPSLSTLPGLVEVDDMVAKSRHQLDSLLKIRDVILAQQAVYEQQAADQRQQHKVFNNNEAPPPPADFLHQQQDMDEGKAGFVGVDTKKRRGRAAPPGRCHSCNRAETPEWRRGPDGARTLCNACGLHYAKLTRKNNGANKSTAAVGSSNLRPKENLP